MSNRLLSGLMILLVGSLVAAPHLQAEDRPAAASEPADGIKAWNAFYQREAEQAYRFTLEPGVELKLDPKPLLRWTNPLEEGSIHGVVYAWRHAGRPVVIGQLFSYLNGKGGRVYCHAMHSLTRNKDKLTGYRDGKVFWTPEGPGVELQDVPKGPAPSANRSTRLLQMKEISRRVTAHTEEATRGKRVLRLQTTPLDRMPETDSAADDGALFSFVVGNDPEVFLLIEASNEAKSVAKWQYGLIRSTRSTCAGFLDEREVWRYDSADKNPSDPKGGYLSVHGIATLPLEAPEKLER